MATMTQSGRGWSVEVRQEWIETTSGYPSPNERWTFTDASGHEHRYDHGYPTLEMVVDAEHWCDGTEGIARHDPHMHVDEAHYECVTCREVIKPKTDPPFTPKQRPGRIDATITGVRSDGATVEAWLTELDLRSIQNADDPDVAALRILDTMQQDRIKELRYQS